MTDQEKKARYLIFQGMSAGGINGPEDWTEYVCYVGSDRWELSIDSNLESLSSMSNLTSAELAMWAVERDFEDIDGETGDHPGEREQELLEIAKAKPHDGLLTILSGLRDGSWPPPPKILRITETFSIARWRGVTRITMFKVLTDQGAGAITSPNDEGSVTLSAETFGRTRSWPLKLSNEQLKEARDLLKASSNSGQ